MGWVVSHRADPAGCAIADRHYNLWAFGVINTLMNATNSERFKARVQELF